MFFARILFQVSHFKRHQGRGWLGELSPRKSVVQSACHYDVTSRVSDFQNGEQAFPFGFGAKKDRGKGFSVLTAKCSSERRIKISILPRKYCSDFLDLEIIRSLLS